jgi:hypothetical protein
MAASASASWASSRSFAWWSSARRSLMSRIRASSGLSNSSRFANGPLALELGRDEWISSVPVHQQLFDALGFEPVTYAHISRLMRQDGASKRKDLADYRRVVGQGPCVMGRTSASSTTGAPRRAAWPAASVGSTEGIWVLGGWSRRCARYVAFPPPGRTGAARADVRALATRSRGVERTSPQHRVGPGKCNGWHSRPICTLRVPGAQTWMLSMDCMPPSHGIVHATSHVKALRRVATSWRRDIETAFDRQLSHGKPLVGPVPTLGQPRRGYPRSAARTGRLADRAPQFSGCLATVSPGRPPSKRSTGSGARRPSTTELGGRWAAPAVGPS